MTQIFFSILIFNNFYCLLATEMKRDYSILENAQIDKQPSSPTHKTYTPSRTVVIIINDGF